MSSSIFGTLPPITINFNSWVILTVAITSTVCCHDRVSQQLREHSFYRGLFVVEESLCQKKDCIVELGMIDKYIWTSTLSFFESRVEYFDAVLVWKHVTLNHEQEKLANVHVSFLEIGLISQIFIQIISINRTLSHFVRNSWSSRASSVFRRILLCSAILSPIALDYFIIF